MRSWKSLTQAETFVYKGGYTSLILFSLYKPGYIAVDVGTDIETLDSRLCLCEVVMHNTARPCIDFDVDIEQDMQNIETAIKIYYEVINNVQVVCKWKVARDEKRTSWHLVVNGVYYYMCWAEECTRLAEFVEKVTGVKTDKGVYHRGKGLRLLGQFKPGNVRKLTKHSEGTYRDFLLYPNGDLLLAKDAAQYFSSTPTSSPANSAPSTPPLSPRHGMLQTSRKWISGTTINPRYLPIIKGVALSHIKNGYYVYSRKYSATCPICNRLHDSENMFGYLTRDGKFRVKCWRNQQDGGNNKYLEYTLPEEAFIRNI